jgi:hypothetical protein
MRRPCVIKRKGAFQFRAQVWNLVNGNCRRNKFETIAKPNCPEPIQIPVRPNIEQEMMTMIKVGSKEEVALLLALFGVLDLPVQAPKKRK